VRARIEAARAGRVLYPKPRVPGGVPIRRLDRRQAETMREELADLYVESCFAAAGQEDREREDFLRRLAADARRPRFDMLIAQGRTLAGCVYGYPVGRDGSWWQGFVGTLPEGLEKLTASGHVFAVSEIVIHPDERDKGTGNRLQEALLADQDAAIGVTAVDAADEATCAAFRSWGWEEVGEIRAGRVPGDLRVLATQPGARAA
jgi:hypothetical protein